MIRCLLLAILIHFANGGRWTGLAVDNTNWYNALNQDIDLLYRDSLVVAIKGCQGADMLFYQYINSGGFAYIRIGDGDNTYSVMMASTSCTSSGCDIVSYATGAHLDCNSYLLFWFRWDNLGKFEVGQNAVVGQDPLMDMDYNLNNDGDFKLRTLQVSASVADILVEFFYYIDESPTMLTPMEGGGHNISLPEDTAVGYVISTTSGSDPESDALTFLVDTPYPYIFSWDSATGYSLNETLDYETQKVYFVTLVMHDGFNVVYNSMTLFVTDVDDEDPVVTAGVTSILEELPVGTVVYGMFLVNDPDTDQTFTYALSGTDAAYFTMTDGELTVAQRINRETIASLQVTVTVTDSASHTGSVDLTITVDDINDNAPACTADLHQLDVAEGTTDENIKLMDALDCTDADDGNSATFTASIISGDTRTAFTFSGLELHGSPKLLDYDTLAADNFAFYLTVHLIDQPDSGPVMTGTVFIVVKVTAVNEFDPAFSSPAVTAGAFPDVVIDETKHHGEVVVSYAATDDDLGVDGDITYSIVSITDDGGNDDSGKFMVDAENGELRVSDLLDADTDTGGVASYDIVIAITDGGATPKTAQATQTITLTGVNDNAPVFNNAPVSVAVSEDAADADVIHTFDVTDSDGDTVTLTLTAGETTLFTINGNDLVVNTGAALDYEAKLCYTVTVQADDTVFQTLLPLTVTLSDVNDEAPVITLSASQEILEELPIDTVLYGLYTISDPDEGDTFTFSVAGADAAFFTTTAEGDLKLLQRVSNTATMTVDLTVTDGASHAVTQTITVTVADINDNTPSCGQNFYEVDVPEMSGASQMLSNSITCTDNDGAPNSDMVISIVSGDTAGVFTFQNGFELWGTPDSMNYEALSGQGFQYQLTAKIEDQPTESQSRSTMVVIFVSISGDNEFDPTFDNPALDGSSKFPDVSVAEDTAAGSLVTTFTASDQDEGVDGALTYQLVSITSDTSVVVTDLFRIQANTGALYVGGALDADTGITYYDVVVKVVDGGATPRSAEGTMKVTITGVNDNAPFISVNHDVTLAEGSAIDTLVATVTVSDADGDTPTLSLGGTEAGSFYVDGNDIKLQGALDYDDKAKACISLEITASDTVHTSMTSLTVTVDPANDETPTIVVNSDPKILEELPIGTVVWGLFTVSDPDDGDTFTYTVTGTDHPYFTINTDGGLVVASRIDREAGVSSLTITVDVEDAAGHTASENIVMTVVDVNDHAPSCGAAVHVVTSEEASSITDQKIMNGLSCTDDDSGDNANFALSIVDGDTGGIFRLEANNDLYGDISNVDYEAMAASQYSYYLTVQVVDTPNQVAARTGTVIIVVEITGKNEFAPEIASPVPDASNVLPDVSVSEDDLPGSSIVTFVGSDADEGLDGEVHFEIVSITSDAGTSSPDTFLIDSVGGDLRVGKGLDADADTGGSAYYDVVIRVKDAGSPAQSADYTQKVLVDNVNDNTPVVTSTELKFTVAEDTASATSLGTVDVSDYDTGDSVTLTISGTHAATFGATGADIESAAALDYETDKCYNVEVSASDGSTQTKTTVTIALTDVVDVAPTLSAYTTVTMAEDLPTDTVIAQLFDLTDPDVGDTFTYTIGGTDGGNFNMDAATGQVSVATGVDVDGGAASLTVTVTATDSNAGVGNVDVTIQVEEVNEFTPVFGDNLYEAEVTENAASAKLLEVTCTDADSDSVELVVPSSASAIFTVSSMELHVDGTQLDYESLSSSNYVYELTLMCRDIPTSGDAKTGSVLVAVTVKGEDEHAPTWSSPVTDGSGNFPGVDVSEAVPPGTSVKLFVASDADDGADGEVTLDIVSVTSDTAADASGKFRIDSSTGSLETAMTLDADASTGGDVYYDVVVQATSGANTIDGTIRVTLQDASDNAPTFTQEFSTVKVPCTTSVGATLMTLATNDIDTVGSSQFSFQGYSEGRFAINPTTGAVTLERPTTSFGDDIYHVITVLATDSGDSQLTDQATIYIQMEYCGPLTTTVPPTTTNANACVSQTDDSALVPMQVMTAVLAVALVGVLGFSLRGLLFFMRPPTPSVHPARLMRKKKLREIERPLEPEPELVLEEMNYDYGNMQDEEAFKHRMYN